jgi:hypothetical protein
LGKGILFGSRRESAVCALAVFKLHILLNPQQHFEKWKSIGRLFTTHVGMYAQKNLYENGGSRASLWLGAANTMNILYHSFHIYGNAVHEINVCMRARVLAALAEAAAGNSGRCRIMQTWHFILYTYVNMYIYIYIYLHICI